MRITKMVQSDVSHDEIRVRLSICCEFLLDEKKPIEEAYESLMGKIGRKLMDYSEFEYWFKRFRNNHFDLGHDTSSDSEQISEVHDKPEVTKVNDDTSHNRGSGMEIEISAEASECKDVLTVVMGEEDLETSVEEDLERKMEDLKLDQRSVAPKIETNIKRIKLSLDSNSSTIFFGDTKIQFDNNDNPECSIVDNLRAVLTSLNLKLNSFEMENNGAQNKIDFDELGALLQSMLRSIHSFHTSKFYLTGFDEDIFILLLKHMTPGTLETISFDISWKNEGNFQKTLKMIEMDQWNQAKTIQSYGVTSLKIGDVLHCENFTLNCDWISPKDVVMLREHLLHSASSLKCSSGTILIRNESLNIMGFKSALGIKYRDSQRPHCVSYRYPLPDRKVLCLNVNPNMVDFWRE